jgi:hypothetical protein
MAEITVDSLDVARNKYFVILPGLSKKLSHRLEQLMLGNFRGILKPNEWTELHKEVNGVYAWGSEMLGYKCRECKEYLVNMWVSGPSCPQGMKYRGCGNMPKGYFERLFGGVVETAREIRDGAVEKAAAVVERARKVPGTLIETARKSI